MRKALSFYIINYKMHSISIIILSRFSIWKSMDFTHAIKLSAVEITRLTQRLK